MNRSERREPCPVAATSSQGIVEGTMTTSALRPQQFTEEQRADLQQLLGTHSHLIAKLEDAVRGWPTAPSPGDARRKMARDHIATAKRLVRTAQELRTAIRDATPLIDEVAMEWNVFSPWSSLPSLYALARIDKASVGLVGRASVLDDAQKLVATLQTDAERWLEAARRFGRERPGQKNLDPAKRLALCRWTGLLMASDGIRLSTVPAKTWGQVYVLLCEVVMQQRPMDVGRDLRDALKTLRQQRLIAETIIAPPRTPQTGRLHRTIHPSKKPAIVR